jgi:hypothetical protein
MRKIPVFPKVMFQIKEHLDELWVRDRETIRDSPNDEALTIIVAITNI